MTDRESAECAEDFGERLMTMRHGSRGVKTGDFAVAEFAGGHAIVDVAELAQSLMDRHHAGGENAHRLRIAEEPAREVDVVHGTVEEDAAARGRKSHEKPRRIVHVEVLRPHQERCADHARLDLLPCIAIAWVETASIADHHLEPRLSRRLRGDAMTIGKLQRQRLFAEHMLAGMNRLDQLLRVKRCRRDQKHRVDLRIAQKIRIVAVQSLDAEMAAGPFQLAGDRTAGGDELCARHSLGEILGVTAAEASEADDAGAKRR